MAFSPTTFGLKNSIRFVDDGGYPQNVSLMRSLSDIPYGHVCLGLEKGDNISVIGVSSGTHPTPDNGRISTAITVGENFDGKARLYGQNIWAGCENVIRGDVVLYLEDAVTAETIDHNFNLGNYKTEFTDKDFGIEEKPSDSQKDSQTGEQNGCSSGIAGESALLLFAVASIIFILNLRREKNEKIS